MRKLIVGFIAMSLLVLPLMAGEVQPESAAFNKAFRAGDYDAAAKAATTAVGKGNALNAQGYAAYQSGDLAKAEQLLRLAVAADDEQYWAWNNLGVVLVATGRLAEARECFEKSIAVNKLAKDGGAGERVQRAERNLQDLS